MILVIRTPCKNVHFTEALLYLRASNFPNSKGRVRCVIPLGAGRLRAMLPRVPPFFSMPW
jgi:hypothetical protein